MDILQNLFSPVANPAAALAASNSFAGATLNSLVMILVTELGDKTFFIAAVLAMRHGRLIVYAGAMGALGVMHVLSSLMGFALPSLLPRYYTYLASTLLFVYFGFRLLKDAWEMEGDGPSDELQEVEEELVNKKGDGIEEGDDETAVSSLENGGGAEESGPPGAKKRAFGGGGNGGKGAGAGGNGGPGSPSHKKAQKGKLSETFTVFTQAFSLTFLAEWGDRSQIATIALAASKNPFGVVLGGLIGHAFCTGLAVVGGRMLAARISERTVAIIGGILFLAFAVHAFYVGPDVDTE